MSIKFLVSGGGGILGLWGGGKCRFYFYGREDLSERDPVRVRTVDRCSYEETEGS